MLSAIGMQQEKWRDPSREDVWPDPMSTSIDHLAVTPVFMGDNLTGDAPQDEKELELLANVLKREVLNGVDSEGVVEERRLDSGVDSVESE